VELRKNNPINLPGFPWLPSGGIGFCFFDDADEGATALRSFVLAYCVVTDLTTVFQVDLVAAIDTTSASGPIQTP
jgi:hypothetical protein